MKVSALSIFSLLLLCSCGFSPMYGTNNSNGASNESPKAGLNRIEIGIIPDRDGQFLRNALIDKFYSKGSPSAPKYQLTLTPLIERIANLDITVDSEATRKQIKLSTTMTLFDIETKSVLLKRNLNAITSHNVLESEFSTLVTEQSAREAALSDLARQVERQIILHFNQ